MKQQAKPWLALRRWFDTDTAMPADGHALSDRIDWLRLLPFVALHLGCLGVLLTGTSAFAIWFALGFYLVRMFAITGFYHRYFSHKTFRTGRVTQFLFALLGCMAVQRGPLWWAAHHRHHHQHSDQPEDLHSPRQHGFFRAHFGWFASEAGFATRYEKIRDFARFPELKFLNRFDLLVPLVCLAAIYGLGEWLAQASPSLETNGLQLVVWGFCISTVALFHATVSINSLGHLWGSRRFATSDQSRNNPLLALLTLGEGWHNNHHRWPVSARQGFVWWELDITYYLLRLMSLMGIVRDLQPVPAPVLQEAVSVGKRPIAPAKLEN